MTKGNEADQRAAVVSEAITWLRTPFAHAQCCKGAGVDCANYLYGVFRNAGRIPELEIAWYPPDWYLHRDEERFLDWVMRYAVRIESAPFKPADIVMYRYGRTFAHGAIILDWPKIAHAYSASGMVVYDDAIANADLAKRKREIYRLIDWS